MSRAINPPLNDLWSKQTSRVMTSQTGSASYIQLRKNSKMPTKPVQPVNKDPVKSIQMQNSIAQPGGGKAPAGSQRNDMAELYGCDSNTVKIPQLIYKAPKEFHPYDFSSKNIPAKSEQQTYYFASGVAPDGDARYIKNVPVARRELFYDKLKSRKNVKRGDSAAIDNTIVFSGTGAFPDKLRVGMRTKVKDSTRYAKQSWSTENPPNTVKSAMDQTTFLAY